MHTLSNKEKNYSLYTALFVSLIDYLGVSLVYPMFSAMLFDMDCPILPKETSYELRGTYLGLLFCLMPLMQFFTSPLWGSLSDSKGRKKPLLQSLFFSLVGYFLATFGVYTNSFACLLASRVLVGIGAGNASIIQASIADVSNAETKTNNFSLHNMVLGFGFAIGPFVGGYLSKTSYAIPFTLTAFLVVLNILFVAFFFKEARSITKETSFNWKISGQRLVRAFQLPGIRTILAAAFLSFFGWAYFYEFTPVFLIRKFSWSVSSTGAFLGLSGVFYAVSCGWLIRPFVKRFRPDTLFFTGLLCSSLTVFFIPSITKGISIFFLIFFVDFFLALVNPSVTTLLSNATDKDSQGEILGVFTSVTSAAFALSPLFAGSVAGRYPSFPFFLGGFCMLLAALIYGYSLRVKKVSNQAD